MAHSLPSGLSLLYPLLLQWTVRDSVPSQAKNSSIDALYHPREQPGKITKAFDLDTKSVAEVTLPFCKLVWFVCVCVHKNMLALYVYWDKCIVKPRLGHNYVMYSLHLFAQIYMLTTDCDWGPLITDPPTAQSRAIRGKWAPNETMAIMNRRWWWIYQIRSVKCHCFCCFS